MKRNMFRLSDLELVEWLCQYSGRQAGFYPGLRRVRARAEREAARRGLLWWRAQTHAPSRSHTADGAARLRVTDWRLALA
jgi:hypothetical protein